ncbi:MAG: 16S rRNA (cytosine(967)-C(5))-methyltransferase RsmB [Pyrinomonadaceae bacterium]
MQISPARRAAFAILRRVEDGGYSSALLAREDVDLTGKDRGLCHELVLGVLRRRLWLDRALEHFAARKIDSLDLPVTVALRLGLYQLRFLSRVPASAAINESVNLVKAARLKSAAPFVNGVLRGATREPNYDPRTEAKDPIERIAIETSHPPWLIERWRAQFGYEEGSALARANNQPAPLAFRFTARAFGETERSTIIKELRAAGAELLESRITPDAWRVDRVPDLLRKLAERGLIYFQDEASQLVAHVVGAGVRDRVLDVCAAPGSKSTSIAAQAPESFIVAADLYEHRLRTLKELANNQQVNNILFVVHDALRALPFEESSFDRVLVDAPCSGTGTLRHNPEIRWRLKPADIPNLAGKQKQIINNASAMVRTGGLLIYSTCSLETDENEAVVTEFLEEHPHFQPSHLKAPSDLETKAEALRTWPHLEDVDGFFVMAFRRKA